MTQDPATAAFIAKLKATEPTFVQDGFVWTKRLFSAGLRGAEVLQNGQAIARIVEQNQDKSSRWALGAREGHEIWWLFDLTRPEGKQYQAVIIDGVYYDLASERHLAEEAIESPQG